MVIQTNEHRRLVTPVKCNLNSRQRKDHITLSPHHHYNDQKSLPKRVLRTETVMLLSCSQTCFTNVVKMMGTTMWGFGLNLCGIDLRMVHWCRREISDVLKRRAGTVVVLVSSCDWVLARKPAMFLPTYTFNNAVSVRLRCPVWLLSLRRAAFDIMHI